MSTQQRFLKLLKDDILKLDLAELDFGVYRILAHRRQELERFFDVTLPKTITEALASGGANRSLQVKARLRTLGEELDGVAQSLGLDSAFDGEGNVVNSVGAFPKGKEYMQLLEERKAAEASAGFEDSQEATIFGHLYAFFNRYYRDGDFLPQPRRGRKAQFSVPYQGEDVHFSWRGRGNHYVKSAEELSSYTFSAPAQNPAVRVRFELVRADQEQNNVKGKTRYFIPLPSQCRIEDAGELPLFIVPFEFRPLTDPEDKRFSAAKKDKGEDAETLQQAALDEATKALLAAAPPALNTKDGSRDFLRHLKRYARKNRTDYFVHPDLGGFLQDELDYYIKNEVLDAGALLAGDVERLQDRLAQARVVQQVGAHIIALLHQIEDVQARLFEKRKLVLRADYLAPMFALPEFLHAEIIANDAQRAAWKELFGVNLSDGDVAELKRRPTLVVDTSHFSDDFKDKLLASYDDLDEALGGVLVHSENYAALRTLGPVYEGRVQTIYIDPPYNTGGDGFLYKDDFSRHSTWLTMMEERLREMRMLMSRDGFIATAIDDNEISRLTALYEEIFGVSNSVAVTAWDRNRKNDSKLFSVGHDYVLFHAKDREYLKVIGLKLREEKGGVREARLWFDSIVKSHNADEGTLLSKWKSYVSTLLDLQEKKRLKRYTSIDPIRGPFRNDKDISWPGAGGPRYEVLHPETKIPVAIPSRGWVYPEPETFWQRYKEGKIHFGPDETTVPAVLTYLFESASQVMPSIQYSYAQSATQNFDDLWGVKGKFQNPKNWRDISRIIAYTSSENAICADFFSGSGPTAQAIIELNRLPGSKRSFLLVEQSEYFDSILIARVQKSLFSQEWSAGQPDTHTQFNVHEGTELPSWITSTPRLVQVLRLESYEDSLNALETPRERSARLRRIEDIFGDQYLLKYFLPLETANSTPLLNLEDLRDPFAYRLRVHTPDGTQERPVDLIETFPLVMGLRPVRRWAAVHVGATPGSADRRYVLMEAKARDGSLVLVVWRPVQDLDSGAEKAWLSAELASKNSSWDRYTTVWMNAQGALPKGVELDADFRRALLSRDPHVTRLSVQVNELPPSSIAQITD